MRDTSLPESANGNVNVVRTAVSDCCSTACRVGSSAGASCAPLRDDAQATLRWHEHVLCA